MLRFFPLLAALALAAVPLVARLYPDLDRPLTRVALAVFGDVVERDTRGTARRRRTLRAARKPTTYREYAARSYLDAAIYGLAGAVVGAYALAAVLAVMRSTDASSPLFDPAALPSGQLFGFLLLFAGVVASAGALGSYYFRWMLVDHQATARATAIDATLPQTVSFLYALSRSGTPLSRVLETLAENEDAYGAAATELSVAVLDMRTFGTDVLTALRKVGRDTRSEQLTEFTENLASILDSGQNLSPFLADQYERYRDEVAAQQEKYLELLSAFAEAYVTALVAGPLFLLTILVVIGLALEDTLPLVRLVAYAGLPFASAVFIVYLDDVTSVLRDDVDESRRSGDSESRQPDDETGPNRPVEWLAGGPGGARATDGGRTADAQRANRERLAVYDGLRIVRRWVDAPIESLLRRPEASFLVTIPLGLVWVALRADPVPMELFGAAAALDGPVVQATIFAVGCYSLAYEINKRHVRAMEASVPDFLDRLASINGAGMTAVESLGRVAGGDAGELTPEVRRTWRDVQWGTDLELALERLDRRVGSPALSRAVALVANALRASGDIAPVLSIAADEARTTRRLRRERRGVMLTYLLVIHVSFLVFLGIVLALVVAFIPAIEAAGGATVPDGMEVSGFNALGGVDADGYRNAFVHAAVIQAVCSGIAAGQLGEGRIADGAKHVAAMLTLAFLALFVAV